MLAPAVTFSYAGISPTIYGPTSQAPTNIGTYNVTASFAGNTNYSGNSGTATITINCANAPILAGYETAIGGGGTIPTIKAPANTQAGDLLVIGMIYERGSNTIITKPTGWYEILTTNQSNNVGMSTFYKKTTSADNGATYTFLLSNSSKWSIGISRITGADPNNPIEYGAVAGASSSSKVFNATAPSVTTTSCNSLVMAYFANKTDASWSVASNSGMSVYYNVYNIQQGLTSNMMAWYTKPNPGITGTKTATASKNEVWVAQQITVNSPSASAKGSVASRTGSTSSTLSEAPNEVLLSAYPNPVTDRVNIQFPEMSVTPSASSINIYDRIGRSYLVDAIWHAENSSLEINFSNLDNGLYIIRVNTEKGSQTLKVSKE